MIMAIIFTNKINKIIAINDYTSTSLSECRALVSLHHNADSALFGSLVDNNGLIREEVETRRYVKKFDTYDCDTHRV